MARRMLNPDDAIGEIRTRLRYPFWVDRAAAMLRHLCYSNTQITTVSALSVDPEWPARGSIRFTRDADGQRYELVLRNHRWLGRPI